MKTIWKFPIEITDEQIVSAPAGWHPLSVQTQNGYPCIWALVDDQQPETLHTVYVNGTGHPVRHNGTFLGTFQVHGGGLVFHTFYDAGRS